MGKQHVVVWYELFDALKKKALKFYEALAKHKRAEMYERIKQIIATVY